MAKILYSVAGEGNGHAFRSKAVIDHLLKKNEVHVFSHGKGFRYLTKFFPVKRILGFHISYINNNTSSILTFLFTMLKFPLMFLWNLRLAYNIIKIKPDVIISDFEPFTNYFSYLLFKPLISIDNQHMISYTEIPKLKNQSLYNLWADIVIHLFIPKASFRFITTFFYPKLKNNCKGKVKLVEPILRGEILNSKTKKGNHIFVYQTSKTYSILLNTLKETNEDFIIYGFDKEEKDGNLTFRKFNDKNFLKELSESKAVIINGGFTLMGEALYLQKPVLSIPVKKQFEQNLNAHYLEEMGFGKYEEDITLINFFEFMKNLPNYEKNLKNFKHKKNKEFFNDLDKKIAELSK